MTEQEQMHDRILEQIGSTAQAAVENGWATPEELHEEIDKALDATPVESSG